MVLVRRLIETPACRRFVQIDIHDFLLGERELAVKYGVPWHTRDVPLGLGVVAAGAVLAGLCLLMAFATKGA